MIVKSFYVSHLIGKDTSSKVSKKTFSEARKYSAVISPVTGSTEVSAYGDRVFKMFTASVNTSEATLFQEGDLVYYGVEPLSEEPYGQNANYKVISVRPYNVKTIIYFEKLP